MQQAAIDLPLSIELLNYYRSRIEAFSSEYDALLAGLEKIKVETDVHHKTEWQLHAGLSPSLSVPVLLLKIVFSIIWCCLS